MLWVPVGILFNEKNKTYHPIPFRMSPPPSWNTSDSFCRYKSIGHHTDGFATIEEAENNIKKYEKDDWVNVGVVWNWNGEGVPAMIEWFSVEKPKPITKEIEEDIQPWTPEWVEKNLDAVRKYFGYD